MAEAIISIVGWIVDPIKEQMKYLFNLRGNMTNLKKAVGGLKVTKKEVEEKIKRATEARDDEVPTERVQNWLDEVQIAESKVTKIEGDLNRLKMCLGGCPLNCWSAYKVSKRAADAVAEVKELLDEEGKMDAVTKTIAPTVRLISDNTLLLPATEILLRNAITYLKDETVGMIGIWGMGGVGKTTLLKKINDHPEVRSTGYDFVIRAVVSQEFNLERLQRDIAQRVRLPPGEQNATAELLAQSLCHFLKNKKVLLLLDDIWKEFDLQNLGIIPNLGSNDNKVPISKVIFTTRSEDVCDGMATFPHQGRYKKINVECLTPDEAWDLFFNTIGETVQNIINTDGRVRERAQTVANKCAGLPLALVVIARAMSSNRTYHQWEDAVNSVNDLRRLQELLVGGTDPLIYPTLKVSYDRLMNDQMRKCFLCCALWPEDHNIPKEELIRRWMGMGHIADFSNINEAISKGHSIIEGLKGAAMLEETIDEKAYSVISCVKLHDIIRGMALWIASDCGEKSNKWIVQTRGKTNTIIAQEAEIVSFMFSEVNSLSQFPYCPNLTALMLVEADSYQPEDRDVDDLIDDSYQPKDRDVDGFIKNVPALSYLHLSNCWWSILNEESVTAKLSNLIGLQYLDLSGCYNLSLSKELVNLTKLKYLFIRGGSIESMPHGLISGLQKLEILDLSYTTYKRWEEEGQASVAELGSINEAGGLKALGIKLTPSLLQRLSSNHPHVPPLWHLQIKEEDDDEEDEEDLSRKRLQNQLRLSKSLFPGGIFPRSLQSLGLTSFDILEEMFIAGGKEDRLDNLEHLAFITLYKLRKISWEGGVVPRVLFKNLSSLTFYDCHKLRDVSWIAQLPFLEKLIILRCNELEQVIGEGAAQEQDGIEAEAEATENRMKILPNLKFLTLVFLNNLRSFCSPQITFPSLQCVEISYCRRLDRSFMNKTKAKVTIRQ